MNDIKVDIDEETRQAMHDYYTLLKEIDDENNRNNNRLFRVLSRYKGEKFVEELKEFIQESEVSGMLTIVDSPKGDYQKEEEFPLLGGAWVEQSCAAYAEDAYYGTIYIKIKDGKWLCLPYEC